MLEAPAAWDAKCLAVFKSETSVHELPFQDSVRSLVLPGVSPAKASAEVYIPAPPNVSLAEFKSPVSVQLVPSYCSVAAVFGSAFPPKASAAV